MMNDSTVEKRNMLLSELNKLIHAMDCTKDSIRETKTKLAAKEIHPWGEIDLVCKSPGNPWHIKDRGYDIETGNFTVVIYRPYSSKSMELFVKDDWEYRQCTDPTTEWKKGKKIIDSLTNLLCVVL